MNGFILIIIVIFVVVPLVKKFKESMDASDSKNRNRYGGYNNPSAYNSQDNKKITYDWKPNYDLPGNKEGQDNPANTSPTPAVNTKSAAPAAKTRPAPAANTRPLSTSAADVKPFSEVVNNNRKKTTAASIRKERAPAPDMLSGQNAEMPDYNGEMPDYNSYEYSAATYDVPETDAFKYADVVVDSEVRVDTVVPGGEGH